MHPDPASVASIVGWYRARSWEAQREPGDPAVLLGEVARSGDAATRARLRETVISLVTHGDTRTRAELLPFLAWNGEGSEAVLRGWLEAPPAWMDEPNPFEPGARLGRGVLRWALNVVQREPGLRPSMVALHARDPFPREWLGGWLNADPHGAGLAELVAALQRGDDLTPLVHHLGVTYGALAPESAPAVRRALDAHAPAKLRARLKQSLAAQARARTKRTASGR